VRKGTDRVGQGEAVREINRLGVVRGKGRSRKVN